MDSRDKNIINKKFLDKNIIKKAKKISFSEKQSIAFNQEKALKRGEVNKKDYDEWL